MPITEAQIKERKNHLGSSDIAALFGLHPYTTAYQVWLEKTGRYEGTEEKEYMTTGNLLEPAILNFAEERLGLLKRNQYRSARSRGLPIGSNVDAILVENEADEPIEAKWASDFNPCLGAWGEAGSDQAPDDVILQCQTHMICTEKDICHLAALLPVRNFQLFHIPYNKDICDLIGEKAIAFWDNNVQADVPPDNKEVSLAVLRKIRREPKSVVNIPDDIVAAWLDAKDAVIKAKFLKKQTETQLFLEMGDAEAGQTADGLVTYFTQTKREHIVKASTYRVLRFKEKKEITNGKPK